LRISPVFATFGSPKKVAAAYLLKSPKTNQYMKKNRPEQAPSKEKITPAQSAQNPDVSPQNASFKHSCLIQKIFPLL
jgi:hypothetical protein